MKGSDYKTIINSKGIVHRFVAKSINVHYVTLSNFLNDKSQMRESKIQRLNEFLGINE